MPSGTAMQLVAVPCFGGPLEQADVVFLGQASCNGVPGIPAARIHIHALNSAAVAAFVFQYAPKPTVGPE